VGSGLKEWDPSQSFYLIIDPFESMGQSVCLTEDRQMAYELRKHLGLKDHSASWTNLADLF
jgi:hypothetical protein